MGSGIDDVDIEMLDDIIDTLFDPTLRIGDAVIINWPVKIPKQRIIKKGTMGVVVEDFGTRMLKGYTNVEVSGHAGRWNDGLLRISIWTPHLNKVM